MFFGGGIAGIIVFALWLYCILDVIATDESEMRNLPKIAWVLIVIFLPVAGSVAWLVLGRPRDASFVPGESGRPRSARPVGPEDSPQFMSKIDDERLRKWEEDLERRERELKRREEGEGPNPGS